MGRENEVQEQPQQRQAAGDDVYAQLAVENQAGARETAASEKLTFNSDSFDQIGPKAKEMLEKAGVTEISITPGNNGVDKIEISLKDKLEIEQDPEKDGCNKLIVGKKLSADFKKGDNGELILENIKGLQAETNLGTANVIRMKMSRDEDGNTEIESTGKKGIFARTKTRVKEGEIMDKAESVLNRLNELKEQKAMPMKTSSLALPNLLIA
jgi:hypothetical protein